MKSKNHLKCLVTASIFVALDIIFTRFFSVLLFGIERISLQFIATSLCAVLLGPVWGAIAAVAGDMLGMLINSAGVAYFPGFTLSAALRGAVYGGMLHQKELSYKRVLLTEIIISIGINLLLNSVWLSVFFGQAFWGILLVKLPFKLVLTPLLSWMLFSILRALGQRGLLKSHTLA